MKNIKFIEKLAIDCFDHIYMDNQCHLNLISANHRKNK